MHIEWVHVCTFLPCINGCCGACCSQLCSMPSLAAVTAVGGVTEASCAVASSGVLVVVILGPLMFGLSTVCSGITTMAVAVAGTVGTMDRCTRIQC